MFASLVSTYMYDSSWGALLIIMHVDNVSFTGKETYIIHVTTIILYDIV